MNTSESFHAVSLQASLTVQDIQKSVAWYRDVVGFVVAKEFERGGKLLAARLTAGAVDILVSQDDGSRGLDRAKGAGISLQFTSRQDIDALASGIKARGGVLESEPVDGFGARTFRLLDPDGFRLVFSGERPS